tara:strand:- start:1005 stop:1865 length:861 start_codon:yes stop_codon:yes gene_type:complete
MIKIYDTNFRPPYKFKVIFNSPHSGCIYTKEFLDSTNVEIYDLRTSEDAFVGELFYSTKFFNCLLMEAKFPRTFIDLNRSHLELDPRLISGDFRFDKTARNMVGMGVIPRISGNGREIYSEPIIVNDALKRLESFYFPYHSFLYSLLLESKKRLGYAVLFDCHSMPSKLNLEFSNSRYNNDPDIILGDLNGTSCSSFLISEVKAVFEKHNFFVTKNQPFSGGYITKKYGNPSNDIHVIQIEINKKLYMDENSIEKNKNFENFRIKLTSVIEELSNLYPIGENIAAE